MANVLVTGGAGFIGSYIVDELIKRKIDVKIATPTGIAIDTLDEEVLTKINLCINKPCDI